MKKYLSLMGVLLVSSVFVGCGGDDEPLAPPNPDLDLTGVWSVVETSGQNSCDTTVGTLWDSYTVTVAQVEAIITVTDNATTPPEVSTGILSGNNIVGLPLDSYPEGNTGGTITETAISLTVDSTGNTINGTISVSYAEPGFTCSGTIVVLANREIPS